MSESDLEQRRAVAESLNGTVRRPLFPHTRFGNLAPALLELTKDCTRVELLIIGPWTSFMRYAPPLLGKVDAIVAQGRPAPDELDAEPGGFNCTYDRDSCLAAFDMLVGRRVRADRHLRALWMDIPHSPVGFGSAEAGVKSDGSPAYPFSPTIGWLDELKKSGGAAAVFSDVLANQPNSWNDTSLWDELAALYLLRPELFASRGGHWEPCVPAHMIRSALAAAMAKTNSGQTVSQASTKP